MAMSVEGEMEDGAEEPVADAPGPPDEEASQAAYTIIGRPQSGKTALIATVLSDMVTNAYSDYQGVEPHFGYDPPSDPQDPRELLRRQFEKVIYNGGQFYPTEVGYTLNYEFDVTLEHRGMFGRPSRPRYPFRMVDGAGELLIPQPNTALDIANPHLKALMNAEGVLLCYPPAAGDARDPESELRDAQSDQRLHDVLVWLERDSFKLKTLVICVTKYEQDVAHMGVRAFDMAENEDFFIETAIRNRISRRLLRKLDALRRKPVDIVITPVSVFGFVEGNFCANYDPYHPYRRGGMLLQTALPRSANRANPEFEGLREWPLYPAAEVTKRWRPYRIIEPFTYLAAGRGGGLTIKLEEVLERLL